MVIHMERVLQHYWLVVLLYVFAHDQLQKQPDNLNKLRLSS